MSSSNCCFLTCIQISPEADQVVWYSHLFKNMLQFVVIHTVNIFDVINKAEVDVFLNSFFCYDPMNVGNLISGSSAFAKSNLNIWKFTIHVLLKPGLENFEHYFAEYIMRNTGLEETQAGIKIAGRNTNNLRYADDTTLWQKVKRNSKAS